MNPFRTGLSILFIGGSLAMNLGHADPGLTLEVATQRGLAQVKQAANHWQKNKTCFACHHQTLPMLAMVEASDREGFSGDPNWLSSQADHTHLYFEKRIDDMEAGDHVPGGAATVGYGLWALSLDDRPADETTDAMVNYLLKIQGVTRQVDRKPDTLPKLEDGRWQATCRRAPMQASLIGDTVLVLLGLEKYANSEQRPQLAASRAAAERWLETASMGELQDLLWRLWGLHQLGGDADTKGKIRATILASQRDDGGWAESSDPERTSDAYSTGQTLYLLCQTGTAIADPSMLRARDFLIRSQQADGSWLVESHVKKKVQPYFENGDPHGEHQFLSTAGTAWATAGLAQLLPSK